MSPVCLWGVWRSQEVGADAVRDDSKGGLEHEAQQESRLGRRPRHRFVLVAQTEQGNPLLLPSLFWLGSRTRIWRFPLTPSLAPVHGVHLARSPERLEPSGAVGVHSCVCTPEPTQPRCPAASQGSRPCQGVQAHVCAHMPCARSWSHRTRVPAGEWVCAFVRARCWPRLRSAQLAAIAARLFSLLLFLVCFFLLRRQHLIVSQPGNITAFSWQPHWCRVWDGGYVELQARGLSAVPAAYAFSC